MSMSQIRYVLKQQTKLDGLWVSEVFIAETWHDVQRAVRAGFLMGEQRWAEGPGDGPVSGPVLFGIDSQGREYK
jgi:hypothetical protein